MTIPGYVLNAEGNDFYYISVSRLHASMNGPSPAVTLESTMMGGRCESSSKTESSLLCSTPPEGAPGLWAWSAGESKPGLEMEGFLGLSSQVHSEVGGQGEFVLDEEVVMLIYLDVIGVVAEKEAT